ncbi:hypothetical protein VNO78_11250 [Psophocarpus tetragonolobus]|uniref:Uncharacterized protein n=1 Tax=Psophocarpus tetragonolobus TaxID=3891 RepID=A0AAN9SM03_PSOTE
MSPRKGHCARKLSRAARDTAHPRSTHECSSTRPSSPSIRHAVQGARTDWNAQVSDDASIRHAIQGAHTDWNAHVSDDGSDALDAGCGDAGRGTRSLLGQRPQAQAVDHDAERVLCGPRLESGGAGWTGRHGELNVKKPEMDGNRI